MFNPFAAMAAASHAVPSQNPDSTRLQGLSEARRTQRYEMVLGIQIVVSDALAVDWFGKTRDIGAGGVRFTIQNRLQVGTAIDYVVTLSNNAPAIQIYCTGTVLRCVKNPCDQFYDVAVTMDRYVFGRSMRTGAASARCEVLATSL